MKIDSLGLVLPKAMTEKAADTVTSSGTSFLDYLKEALNETERLQSDARQKAAEVMSGDAASIHQSMIADEKAYLALQMTIEVRSKLLEAYQEIMRMSM